MFKSSKATSWQQQAAWTIKCKQGRRETITAPITVTIHMYLKYDRDIDSSQKLLLDAMENSGIIENDRQARKWSSKNLRTTSIFG